MLDDGVHGREDRPGLGALRDAHAEALLDAHRELERVKRVEPEPVPEEGPGVVDIPRGLPLEVQVRDHQLFQLAPNIRRIHGSSSAYHEALEGATGGNGAPLVSSATRAKKS